MGGTLLPELAGILANVGRGGNLLPELVGSLQKVVREPPKLEAF